MTFTRAQFIKKVVPMAVADSKKSQILASLTIAQAILESNNGNSTLTREANALFGIKANASWRGKVWTGKTIEYMNNVRQDVIAGFRAYESWQESINDHSALLTQNKRYAKVVGEKDYKKACLSIMQAGYATDPQYAQKLIMLIEENKLYRYDQQVQIDEALAEAVSRIIKSGIAIDFNKWKREDLMKLSDVPSLLSKLGGIDHLVAKGVIGQPDLWQKGMYQTTHVRSLLIKYAAKLK